MKHLLLILLLTSCAGPTGWHIGTQIYTQGEWKEARQDPPYIIVQVDDIKIKSTCIDNALIQGQLLEKMGFDVRFIIYYIDNGKPEEVDMAGNYWELQKWFDER